MSPRSRVAWWLAPVATLGLLVPLLAAAPAAYAEDGATDNCVPGNVLECLQFSSGYADDADPDEDPVNNRPTDDSPSWDIEMATAAPSNSGQPWQGTFRVVQHSTVDGAGGEQCLQAHPVLTDPITLSKAVTLEDCSAIANQRWYVEPVGREGEEIDTTPGAWDPWALYQNPTRAEGWRTKFYLRSAGGGDVADLCYGAEADGLYILGQTGRGGRLFECGQNPSDIGMITGPNSRMDKENAEWNLFSYGGTHPRYRTESERRRIADAFFSAALVHALAVCATPNGRSTCAGKLYDESGGSVSDWSRIDNLQLNQQVTPTTITNGCAAGPDQPIGGDDGDDDGSGTPDPPASARVIYNGGDAPMTTTLGSSGTNEFSASETHSLSVEVSAGYSAFITEGEVTVTTSHEWGKTWTRSHTFSQDVTWTVPPHRYARATVSTAALRVRAAWRFHTQTGGFNPWQTDAFSVLNVPYSSDPTAGEPDTLMSVYNSWDWKACSAAAPSVLDPGRRPEITNTTAPGIAPTIGDVLSVKADDPDDPDGSWWDTRGSSEPVAFRYQWYRQRGAQPAETIDNARGSTYLVTDDDITDPEVMDRFGPYHIFVGVTDVANQYRFDSREYLSLTTSAVTEERARIGDTQVQLSILNQDVDAGTDTIVDISASAAGSVGPPSGTVTIRDNDAEIGVPVELGPDGTVRTRLRLPRGTHALEAVYGGDGTLSGGVSNVARTTISGSPSKTTLELVEGTTAVGATSHARVRVAPTGSADVPPGGQVQLRADGNTLGAPITLGADGTAEVVLPAPTDGGQRQITAGYLGDQVFDPSTSEPATQKVATIATKVGLEGDVLITHRKGRIKWVATVAAPSGTPQGSVQFRVDGLAHGAPIAIDGSGRAWLKMTGLALGRHRVTAQYAPTSSVHGGALSDTINVEVRRHGAKTKAKANHTTIKKGRRLVVTGTVKGTKGAPPVAGRKVQLLVNGVVVAKVKVARNGSYRLTAKRQRLLPGDNVVQVRYVGSRPRSIAPDLSKRIQVRRT
ncbi:Ig-like domain repeat protein [Nocardioides humi]|uniref:Bacterial Ig-like domain-containing protein n=1 Tax=Nocardioides humi TaxID=449461 RepID=A0ABN2AC04_9ACTN|nr:Ig-like domain repeat protein [Nocardioides humi]